MSEPVQGVVRTGGVERRSSSQERLKRHYPLTSHHYDDEEKIETGDMVDISEEAHKRADGTYHKSILEHLEEED